MKHRTKMTLTQKRNFYGYFFIFPLILGVALIFLPNVIQTIRFSLNDIVLTGKGYQLVYRGITYYRQAFFVDPQFLPQLGSNLEQLAIHIPIILIFSLFIATILNQKFHGRVLARIIFFIPVILSTGIITVVDSSALTYLDTSKTIDTGTALDLSSFTQITTLLSSLNFSPFLVQIVTSSVSGIYSIVSNSGMQILIFLAGLQEIPPALYEAASIEGCSKWELFWKITFPMISPQIAINMVYTIADTCYKDNSVLTYTNTLAFSQNQFALATTMNLTYMLCLALLIALLFGIMYRVTPRRS